MNAASIARQVMEMTAGAPAPPSLADNPPLMGLNLFVMTAAGFLGAMMFGKQAARLWCCRHRDHPKDPVSIYRLILMFAGGAVALRGGAEAVHLWSYSAHDPIAVTQAMAVKRWLDPISVSAGLMWMALAILGEPMIEHQLRKAPLPVDMWSRWPALRRPLAVVVLSLVMAGAAVVLR